MFQAAINIRSSSARPLAAQTDDHVCRNGGEERGGLDRIMRSDCEHDPQRNEGETSIYEVGGSGESSNDAYN